MSQNVTWNGSVYIIPDVADADWGQNVTDYLVALPQGALQKTGGAFTLSTEVDFGSSFGLKSLYYKGRTANPATTGILRLAVSDFVKWRNNANGADLALGVSASDRLQFQTSDVILASGGAYTLGADLDLSAAFGIILTYVKSPTANIAGAGLVRLARTDEMAWRNQANSANLALGVNASNQLTFDGTPLGMASYNFNDTTTIDLTLTGINVTADIVALSITNGLISASAAIDYSKLNLALSIVNADISASAAIAYSKLNLATSIVNGDVAAAAAIARTKLASGSGFRVVTNDTSGVMTDAAAITAARALISDANGIPTHSSVTSTELGYVSGVTAAIQTQLDNKSENILINGGFEFWQRNTTFSTPANGAYTTDRWVSSYNGTPTFTIARESTASNVDNGTYSASFAASAVGGSTSLHLRQDVENGVSLYTGKTISFSVRVKTTATNFKIRIEDNLGSSTSSAHSGSGLFETLSVSRSITTTSGALAFEVGFVDSAPQTGLTSYVDSAMLVVGSVAVPFVAKNYQTELAQCQRYCELIGGHLSNEMIGVGQAYTTTATDMVVPFKVEKRVAPTMTVFGSTAWKVYNSSGSGLTTTSVSTSLASVSTVLVTAQVASGLSAGNATVIYAPGPVSTNYILAEAEI